MKDRQMREHFGGGCTSQWCSALQNEGLAQGGGVREIKNSTKNSWTLSAVHIVHIAITAF